MDNHTEEPSVQAHAHLKTHEKTRTEKTKKFLIVLIVLLSVFSAAVSAYFIWESPPVLRNASAKAIASPEPADVPARTPAPTLSPEEAEEIEIENIKDSAPVLSEDPERKPGIYTILLAGIDDAAFLTDTIIVGYLDTVNHQMNFVNIPRDTIILSGEKINSVYYGANRDTGKSEPGIEALIDAVSNIIGYDVDCYAFINIRAFIDVIDAIGGIWFDVPVDIEYIDQANDYAVFQRAGYYHLDGETSMGVVRYREGYPTGDLGRIDTQHAFLKAVAEQCLSLGKIPHMKKVLDIISSETMTDLSYANIAYFMRQALLCRGEDIRFMTVPAHNVFWNDISYAVVEEWQWCEMLNEYFNPFTSINYYPQSLNIIIEAYGKLVYSRYPIMPFG